MRTVFLVSAFLSLLCPMTANADVLAVCGRAASPDVTRYANIAPVRLIEPEAADAPSAMTSLALVRDAKGFDVVMNWGEENQLSLRAQGADITGNEMGPDFIHLIVFRAGGHRLEHFLFNLDDQAGELIWNASDETLEDKDVSTFDTACIKPNH
jgi:hypothetical protein